MTPKTIYFGHPINTYDTMLEYHLALRISEAFPGWPIENPNQVHHQIGYQYWKDVHSNGMGYYFNEVLPQCDAGIFLPFRDGKWGAGVFGEAEFLAKRNLEIYQITPEGIITLIEKLAEIPTLSIAETRARIRTKTGQIAPF